MALSLTCTCGAKLEIDEKFAGKVITCPDCQKEISTAPEPVRAARTSGFAIASLFLALIGPLTLILPLLAIGLGAIALRHITRRPEEVGGRRLASAGMILGGFFAFLSVVGYYWPGLFRVDGVFREIEWAGKLDFSGRLNLDPVELDDAKFAISITRPSFAWGKASPRLCALPEVGEDDLILINPWSDAQLTCINRSYTFEGEKDDIVLTRAGDRFVKSQLVCYLAGPAANERKEEKLANYRDIRNTSVEGGKRSYEMLVDLNLPGPPRTFLLRVTIDNSKMFIVAAGTRSDYFARIEPQLRQFVDSYQVVCGS